MTLDTEAPQDSSVSLRRKRGLRFLFVSMFAALLAYAALTVWAGLPEALSAAGNVELKIIAAALGLTIANTVLRFCRWILYLRILGHRLPLVDALAYYYAGFLFITTPARAGEAIRSVYLKRHGIPYTDSLSVVFVERITDIGGMVLLSFLLFSVFGGWSTYFIAAAAIAFVVFLVNSPAILKFIHQMIPRQSVPRLDQILDGIERSLDAATTLVKMKTLITGLLFAVSAFSMTAGAFYLIVVNLGIDIGFAPAAGIYAIANTGGSLTFLPGGLGSTEAIMGILLAALGAQKTSAIVAIIISRACSLWFYVVLGGIATVFVGMLNRRVPVASESEGAV